MYVCGSTVYQRVHVGNSRPFVLGMWLRSWLRETGYEVTLVHNITDVDDKVYAEAARARDREPRALRAGDRVVLRGHERSRPRTARRRAARDGDDPRDRRVHRRARRARTCLRGGRRRVLQRRGGTRVRPAVGRSARGHGLAGVERAEARSARLRALEVAEAARGRSVGLAVGSRSTGLAHRVLRNGRKHLGPEFEIHGGGLDLRFPHHENELAQSSALGHRFAHVWMHNGMLELDAEKMSKSLGNVVTLRNVLDAWGREALLVFHLTGHWSKPVDFSDEAMESAAARAEGFREVFRNPSEPGAGGCLGAVRGCTRRRLQHAGCARRHARVARPRAAATGARHLRARVARRRTTKRRRRSSRSQSSALRRAPRTTSTRPIASEPRSRRPVGTCATKPTAFRLVRRR